MKRQLAKTYSAACLGLEALAVEIEVDVANGLPQLLIVGLPDQAVRESRDRVKAAIKNSGFPFPSARITINLAPADLKKEGPAFDLAIAIGILAASGYVKGERLASFCLLGELSLEGQLRAVCGALSVALSLNSHTQGLIVSQPNAVEAALARSVTVYGARHLREVVEFLNEESALASTDPEAFSPPEAAYATDFSEVRGQYQAKRALEIAVAGGHNLLMIGPPGSGKTMLARRLPTIFPALTCDEWLDLVRLYGLIHPAPLAEKRGQTRPFRSPHHTISPAGLVGGGPYPRPGEVSLSHHGVLVLDELPEFNRNVLEVLRGPLEDREVTISRAKQAITFPASFMLVCAMNPCPCGYLGDPKRVCHCGPSDIHRYLGKISGPLLDRMDIHIEVPKVTVQDLHGTQLAESSEGIRKRVEKVRTVQKDRFGHSRSRRLNGEMGPREIKTHCPVSLQAKELLALAMEELGLSARGYHKILKVARTISDLAGEAEIGAEAISEAIQYRSLDRLRWG